MKIKKRIPRIIGVACASILLGFFSFLILTQWIQLIPLNGPNYALQQLSIMIFIWATVFSGFVFKTEQKTVWLVIKIILFSSSVSLLSWFVFRALVAYGMSGMP